MKVAVFGATGMVGSAIVEEGRSRGHDVTTVSSRPGAADVTADVTDLGSVQQVAADVDAVVISVPPSRTGGSHEPWIAAHESLAGTPLPARLAMVGGAGSSLVNGVRLLDSPGFPPEYVAESSAAVQVLEFFRASPDGVDWVILSPAPVIEPGERTGRVRLGTDDMVGDHVTTQNFAIALWNELESPAHRRARFTVADA
jgi:putative NADH-flavin reductase